MRFIFSKLCSQSTLVTADMISRSVFPVVLLWRFSAYKVVLWTVYLQLTSASLFCLSLQFADKLLCSSYICSSNLSSPGISYDYLRPLSPRPALHATAKVLVTSVLLHWLWFKLRYSERHARKWEESDSCHLTSLNPISSSVKGQSGFTFYILSFCACISNPSILQGWITLDDKELELVDKHCITVHFISFL